MIHNLTSKLTFLLQKSHLQEMTIKVHKQSTVKVHGNIYIFDTTFQARNAIRQYIPCQYIVYETICIDWPRVKYNRKQTVRCGTVKCECTAKIRPFCSFSTKDVRSN